MITNDRQYKIVKSQIVDFTLALDEFSSVHEVSQNIHPKILEAQKNAIVSKLHEIISEVQEYEDLKEGRVFVAQVKKLEDLPIALIKSRIANGLTQSTLAKMLDMKEQQVQRYESDNYETASLKTLMKVAEALKIRFNADVLLKQVEAPDVFNLRKYPFKQMFQRNWFKGFKGSLNDAVKQSATLIAEIYDSAGMHNFQGVLNRRSVRSGASYDDFALDIWYAKVIIEARKQELENLFIKEIVTDEWLKTLAQLSAESNGPELAVDYLKENGIRVVIEASLDGMLLDGAALLLDDMLPVIALTLRYDRLDNFWFVLFHELAHIILHLGAEFSTIFDDLDAKAAVMEVIEKEADQFALNAIIPDKTWKKSLVRFSPSIETIKNLANSLKIHPALIAGRIRRETGKYFQFTELIGQGEVRKNFATFFNN